ncbi:synaptotagmin-5-like [Solanum stenotomum]|uniref:synaptotagmin-5-like n=1 Tax=Solanum stenotomum TaxID=172797 RepID=UPI0020D11561|nr:synaptotagmin-5-like [Solanum stenotomum]
MTVEDSRKIFTPEQYPSWVVFSNQQKLAWLNSHLEKIWPYVDEAASELVKSSVEPVLEQYWPVILASLKFSKFTLDTVAPQFTGISIIEDGSDGITMELEMQWDGTIPSWVFSLPLLSSVSLQHNRFRGLADEVIKTNPTLKQLHLSNNQLSGSFPQSLVNLTNLKTLGLSSNNITIDEGMNITFLSLSSLFLSSCQLKDFPHLLRNVKTLVYLDISNNMIRGQIPDWFSGMRIPTTIAFP